MGTAVIFGALIRAIGVGRAPFRDFALHARFASIGAGALLGHMLAREADPTRGVEWVAAFLGMACGAGIGAWAARSRLAKPLGALLTALGAVAILGMAVVSQLSRGEAADSRPVGFRAVSPPPEIDRTNTHVRLVIFDVGPLEPVPAEPRLGDGTVFHAHWMPPFHQLYEKGVYLEIVPKPFGDPETHWIALTGMSASRHAIRDGVVLRSTSGLTVALRIRSRPIRDWLQILRVAREGTAEAGAIGCKTIADIATEMNRSVALTNEPHSSSESRALEKPDLLVVRANFSNDHDAEIAANELVKGMNPNDVVCLIVLFRYAKPLEHILAGDFPMIHLLGKDVRPGERVQAASIYDLAPTLLHILGIPAGRDMPGRVLTEALTDSRPARRISTWESPPVAR